MELETSRITEKEKSNYKRIKELTKWFLEDYQLELGSIARAEYFGYTPSRSKWSLQCEAYEKENELLKLKGFNTLPEKKFISVL